MVYWEKIPGGSLIKGLLWVGRAMAVWFLELLGTQIRY